MSVRATRREIVLGVPASLLAAGGVAMATTAPTEDSRFLYGLNTSTIRGQKLSLMEMIRLAADVGYGGLEPWISDIDEHVQSGGSLDDVAKLLGDTGMRVESAIGFPEWIVDDDARRAKGLEEARRAMDLVRRIGGTRIAAPPAGATDRTDLDLRVIADRYRALLEVGDAMEVTPQLELWGFSKTLSRLSEVMYVAIETGHPKACVLADVYHLYKGGNDLTGLGLLGPRTMFVLHMNDYPAEPSREVITDAQRVFPGDGVAPVASILRTLRRIGFQGMLSLELFNREYWERDARTVLDTGLQRMKAAVAASVS